MIILSILQIILYLLVIPFSMGLAFTRFFDEKHNTIGNILTSGFIMELAAFQVLFLAFYRLHRTLTELTWCASVVLVYLAVLSLACGTEVGTESKMTDKELHKLRRQDFI